MKIKTDKDFAVTIVSILIQRVQIGNLVQLHLHVRTFNI